MRELSFHLRCSSLASSLEFSPAPLVDKCSSLRFSLALKAGVEPDSLVVFLGSKVVVAAQMPLSRFPQPCTAYRQTYLQVHSRLPMLTPNTSNWLKRLSKPLWEVVAVVLVALCQLYLACHHKCQTQPYAAVKASSKAPAVVALYQ